MNVHVFERSIRLFLAQNASEEIEGKTSLFAYL